MIGYLVCASTTAMVAFFLLASPMTGRVEDPVLGSFPAINFVLFTILTGALWTFGMLPLVFCFSGRAGFRAAPKNGMSYLYHSVMLADGLLDAHGAGHTEFPGTPPGHWSTNQRNKESE